MWSGQVRYTMVAIWGATNYFGCAQGDSRLVQCCFSQFLQSLGTQAAEYESCGTDFVFMPIRAF